MTPKSQKKMMMNLASYGFFKRRRRWVPAIRTTSARMAFLVSFMAVVVVYLTYPYFQKAFVHWRYFNRSILYLFRSFWRSSLLTYLGRLFFHSLCADHAQANTVSSCPFKNTIALSHVDTWSFVSYCDYRGGHTWWTWWQSSDPGGTLTGTTYWNPEEASLCSSVIWEIAWS